MTDLAPLPDHHLHTRYSFCCYEEYDLVDVARKNEVLGMPYTCVTDHVHHPGEGFHVVEHIKAREKLRQDGYPSMVFVGIEASIQDFKGHLPLENLPGKPDYIIAGDHWIPGTNISMNDLPYGSRLLKEMHALEPQKLRNLYDNIVDMYKNTIQSGLIKFLVHPFDTLLRMTNFDKNLLDLMEPVCEACQKHGVALEVNKASLFRYSNTYSKVESLHSDCMKPMDFYTEMYKIASKFDIKFSTCSDAHKLVDVGNLELMHEFIKETGIEREKILFFDIN